MTTSDVADMFVRILKFDDIYAGNIDANKGKSIGVYTSKNERPQRICIGGKSLTKTLEKHISILIHWTDEPAQAEMQARNILDKISDIREYSAGKFNVHFIMCKEPVSVGRDERGICEYVIEATIYFERKEQL